MCENNMTFEECELTILRHAVDKNEKMQKRRTLQNFEDVKKIIDILEKFIIKKKCICYGGIAINNILPKEAQFYNKDIEIPDYDFFTPHALKYAKELADLYYKNGYTEVEAKSGMHHGTFKIYVNFIPIADITYIHKNIYKNLLDEAIIISGIRYIPINFIRMGIYLELSRPMGDVSRWEKIYKRLLLLNKYYPFEKNLSCEKDVFQRKFSSSDDIHQEQLFEITKNVLIEQNVVFFGGYAFSLYSKYDNDFKCEKIPDFDVLSEDPEKCSLILMEQLLSNGYENVKEYFYEGIGEIVPPRIEIRVNDETIVFIYYPIACHNYNTIYLKKQAINIASIDTILSFYLAFIFTDNYNFYKKRLLCMAKFLFYLEEKNKLTQKGLLKRFNMKCIGKQTTIEEIKMEKSKKFKELKPDTEEYEMWFLKYNPSQFFHPKRKTAKRRNLFSKTNKRRIEGYLF